MTTVLALETATEACSLALLNGGVVTQRHEVIPRGHYQRIFGMLRELLPGGDIADTGIDVLAYGSGPGSFTGLRIAASLAQGLSFSTGLPVVAVPTLATLAQTALRAGAVSPGDTVLCTLDARINEVYTAVYSFVDGIACLREGPWALSPGDQQVEFAGQLRAVGSGCRYLHEFPAELVERIASSLPDLLPEARDVAELAGPQISAGRFQAPADVSPVYVRDEISWKKLAEQGRPG
ncbi:MAG: tRNA (adenosine(37)-N6)-threonylcarbamoyltransferase complex dimerization subunit type 1 TsaB [Halioglobus sp.]|nr:tRNA (adenosine(37)-N6)-threonylcarbamoyltransferase complex dimerization subunit type 1 TsaB [Halioglobus sp.]